MAAGASAVDSSRVKRGLRLAVLTVALVQNMLCAPANADVTGDQPREVPVIINNKPLRYGNYCGPGPAEVNPTQGCRMLPSLPAADFVDEGCLLHDQAYCNCRKTLESKGKPFPPALFVIMAIRGELPDQLGSALLGLDREFAICVHEADRKLIADFQAAATRLPPWWDNAALAPRGAEGTQGFREACAFGVGQQCVLPSKTLFFRLKETFEKDLRLDGKTGLSEPPSSLASPLP